MEKKIFSHRTYLDSNPHHFDHESGTVPLSYLSPHGHVCGLCCRFAGWGSDPLGSVIESNWAERTRTNGTMEHDQLGVDVLITYVSVVW